MIFALSGRRVLSRARISPASGEILAPVPPPGLAGALGTVSGAEG